MQRSHYVVLSERNCDLSKGQGERANVECPVAAGRLQYTVGLGNEILGGDKLFARSKSLAVCFMICFASFPSERFKLNNS